MIETIKLATSKRQEIIDLTKDINAILKKSGVKEGLCNVYSRHTTTGITINENDDSCVCDDMVEFMKTLVKRGEWTHDSSGKCDRTNGDSHIMGSIMGPSETVPIHEGKLLLGQWQNIFFCEFDGPRDPREVIVTIIDVG